MPPSRIATLLRLFQQTPPAGVADNEEVGAKLAQLAAQIKPSNEGRNSLERVAQLPGHALANSIDFAGMAIQPEKIVQGIKGVINNPDQAIAGAKQFGAEAVEEPIKLLEEMGIGEFLAPGAGGIAKLGMAGASLGGGNKFLKKLGQASDAKQATLNFPEEGALKRGVDMRGEALEAVLFAHSALMAAHDAAQPEG